MKAPAFLDAAIKDSVLHYPSVMNGISSKKHASRTNHVLTDAAMTTISAFQLRLKSVNSKCQELNWLLLVLSVKHLPPANQIVVLSERASLLNTAIDQTLYLLIQLVQMVKNVRVGVAVVPPIDA